ncbi:MAG: exodeoxyribonuclease III [Betaproteobacteria bacterium TMED82]|nr:MAG: exodeoxyribonuclease III [Betaproteobacteria bacterium TMED82]|tara:strand:- start:56855 stop:57673 length:819 start_codon:yes stop_codon:yes gene_type:complete
MLKVISLNVNGIRASVRKGLIQWLIEENPDFICIQELKAQRKDLGNEILEFRSKDGSYLKSTIFCAERPGYSGVGIYSKQKPTSITAGIGVKEFDDEGRVLKIDFDNHLKNFPLFSIVSLYLPSGSASESRQASKFRFLKSFKSTLKNWEMENSKTGREFLLCGDLNIAHTNLDLKNWKNNQKNSGFLPAERSWLTETLFNAGWKDIFRVLEPKKEQFTWWSQRGRAREKNVGWRIDYQIATANLAISAASAKVAETPILSDHAPLIINFRA